MEDNHTEEFWFVDSWGWASSRNPDTMKFDRNLGHIKNCLKFLGGPQPRWYDPERPVKRAYVRRNVKRGTV